ncbi:MAG: RluA family pseudouridine synthase [Patescibacteria group bacterium]|jgi:23S rRNA pseudouridine1911/1915/1917 synthase
MSSYIIDRLYERVRLDQYLVERLIVYSRSQIQSAIANGKITVNGKRVKAHYSLQFKDRVLFDEDSVQIPEPHKVSSRQTVQTLLQPKVIHTTSQFFVIEKPAGWLMHKATEEDDAPLISDYVLELDPTLSIVGEKPELRPGIVHRLDRDASGLIVVARTQSFYDHIKQQFIKRTVKKTYQALVFGHPAKEEDDIRFRIARSHRKARMAAYPVAHPDGQTATTHFVVKERFQHTTLLGVWIETGRTNQIRVHLAAYDLPIVGDTIYGKNNPGNAALGRVMLHADYISFFGLGGERVEFKSELPEVFQALVDKGRKNMVSEARAS